MAARSVEGFIAVNRFGLGAKPGELEKASSDPRSWLKAQLSGKAAPLQALAGLPPSTETAQPWSTRCSRTASTRR